MKKLKPQERKQILKTHIEAVYHDWTCRYGEWNRDKLLEELKREIKANENGGGK